MRKVFRIVTLMLTVIPAAVMLGCTERTDLAPVWTGHQNLNEILPDVPYPPPVTKGHAPPAQRPRALPPAPPHRHAESEKTKIRSAPRQAPAPAAKPDGIAEDRKKPGNARPGSGMQASSATAKPASAEKPKHAPAVRKGGETLKKTPASKIPAAEVKKDPARLNFGWPLKGRILKNYRQTSRKGIKIAGAKGQTVRAAEGGKVVYSGQGLIGYGNLLIIKHNDQYLTAYANNNALLAKEGDFVKKGQEIATVGVGASRKAMLHFEIRNQGKPVDPLKLLPKL
jgi:lipoprotein NlpD